MTDTVTLTVSREAAQKYLQLARQLRRESRALLKNGSYRGDCEARTKVAALWTQEEKTLADALRPTDVAKWQDDSAPASSNGTTGAHEESYVYGDGRRALEAAIKKEESVSSPSAPDAEPEGREG